MHKEAKHVNPDPAPQNAADEVGQQATTAATAADVAQADDVAYQQAQQVAQAATAAARDEAAARAVPWEQFPLVTAAARQYHARARAVQALQAAGETEMAATLQAKAPGALEEELALLLAALGYEEAQE